jgi:hypothetical protein
MFALLLACAPDDTDTDTDTDADTDTDSDTDTDTDTDSDTDTDTEVWPWCPAADSAVFDPTWTGSLEVTASAVYCVVPNESRSLAENRAAKAKLRLVEGVYPFPTETGDYTIAVPSCVAFPDGTGTPLTGAGPAEAGVSTYSGIDYLYVAWTAPLADTASSWSLSHALSLVGSSGVYDPLAADGDGVPSGAESVVSSTLHPNATGSWENESRILDSCNSSVWRSYTHVVTFEGGTVTLVLQIGFSDAGTQPSAFVSASGELDGTPWEQRDYWSLVYQPEHHHFGRNFAVVLPEAIGAACALRVEGLGSEVASETTVSLADCTLEPTEARTVTGVVVDGG